MLSMPRIVRPDSSPMVAGKEVGFPAEPATRRSTKQNKELAEVSGGEMNESSQAAVVLQCSYRVRHHRSVAITAQTASIIPNGQAPCKNPYIEPKMHKRAKPRINQRLRSSNA